MHACVHLPYLLLNSPVHVPFGLLQVLFFLTLPGRRRLLYRDAGGAPFHINDWHVLLFLLMWFILIISSNVILFNVLPWSIEMMF